MIDSCYLFFRISLDPMKRMNNEKHIIIHLIGLPAVNAYVNISGENIMSTRPRT